MNYFFVVSFVATLLLGILTSFKVDAVTCTYYPFYPSTFLSSTTSCSGYCCSGYSSSSYDACCNYSTWWVSLIVIGVIGIIIAIVVTIVCCIQKKKRRTNPGGMVLSNQSMMAGGYPNAYNQSTYPPAAYPSAYSSAYPAATYPTTNYPVPNTNPYPAQNDQPPKYDAFANQTATTTITDNNSTAPMPVLPAAVGGPTNNSNTTF